MVTERVDNNEFKSKSLPQRTQYLKDCDDDNVNNFRSMNNKLKFIIGVLSFLTVTLVGYMFDQLFLS